jgi:hypothetical protein
MLSCAMAAGALKAIVKAAKRGKATCHRSLMRSEALQIGT